MPAPGADPSAHPERPTNRVDRPDPGLPSTIGCIAGVPDPVHPGRDVYRDVPCDGDLRQRPRPSRPAQLGGPVAVVGDADPALAGVVFDCEVGTGAAQPVV